MGRSSAAAKQESFLIKKGVALNIPAARHVAAKLGIELPSTADERAVVEALREAFVKRMDGIDDDRLIVCAVCGEMTDPDDRIDRCPYCGDLGDDDVEEDEVVEVDDSDVIEGETADDAEPTEPPVVDIHGSDPVDPAAKSEKLAKNEGDLAEQLKAEKEILLKSQRDLLNSGYDMGLSLRRINEKELWKVEGHKTFRAFLKSCGIGHTLAYDLMNLAGEFDRKTFQEVGRKKLAIVSRASDPETREEMIDDAKKGASKRDLEKKAREKGVSKSKAPAKTADRSAPKIEGDSITLLARVGGQPQTLQFVDRKTQEPLKTWTPESYAEVKLSENVSQFIGLKTDAKGSIVGLVVAFRRVEATKPATAADAKKNAEATASRVTAKVESKVAAKKAAKKTAKKVVKRTKVATKKVAKKVVRRKRK